MPMELGAILQSVVATLQVWRCVEGVMYSAKLSIHPPGRTRKSDSGPGEGN